MRKKTLAALLVLFLLLCSGCGKTGYPDLPKDGIAFEMGSFEDTEHDSALFGTLEHNGRIYIMYGTTRSSYGPKKIDACIGYIIRDEHSSSFTDLSDKNRRVYTLAGDEEQNFLIDYDDTVKLMDQPSVWRAIDTRGKDIEIPDFIEELGYDFWK